ncbi:beta-fructofuranosidase-like protein, partial [Trypanosoma theileri]
SFVKLPTNPVLTEYDLLALPLSLAELEYFRDPTNFWVNPDNTSEWLVAFVASAYDDFYVPVSKVFVFATSDPNLAADFRYSHVLWQDTLDLSNELEHPDFFKLGDDYYLKVSTMLSGQDYWVYGNYTKNGDDKTIF